MFNTVHRTGATVWSEPSDQAGSPCSISPPSWAETLATTQNVVFYKRKVWTSHGVDVDIYNR